MRIECPTCETGFNVSDGQVGQKGLCPKCETKFIIPSDPEAEIEVLAEGTVPEAEKPKGSGDKDNNESKRTEEPAKKEKTKGGAAAEKEKAKEEPAAKKEKVKEAPAAKKEKVKERPAKKAKEGGASTQKSEGGDDEVDTGGAGKAIGLLAIGLIIGLAIGFVLGKMTAGNGEGGSSKQDPSGEGDTKDPFGIE